MMPQPPPGQGPIDPRGAFSPPSAPSAGAPRPSMSSMPGAYPPPPPQMPHVPQVLMPPPYFAPPPPRRGGGIVRGILLVLVVISVIINFALLAVIAMPGGGIGSATETVLVDGDARQTVAVLELDGVITGVSSERFEKLMRQLEQNNAIKALVLEIDSPGGEVTASDEIYRRIMKYKADKGVKVVATMGSLATSGGYYVACAADHIVAQPTTLTGNIGVVMQRFNFSELMEKWGVADTTITPEGSKFKYAESPFRPENPEAAAYLRGLIDDTYGRFKQIVAKGRGSNLKATIDQVADGRVYTANDALKMGLIDQIGYADEAYAKAAALASLTKQHVVKYQREPSLLDILSGDTSAKTGVDFRGVNVKIDRSVLDEITTPRLMSIYRGE